MTQCFIIRGVSIMYTTEQYAAHSGVSVRTVQSWNKKGYFGINRMVRGKLSIPDDMPKPYTKGSKVRTQRALVAHLLIAADQCCSVFYDLFPNISARELNAAIEELINEEYIECINTPYRISYLRLRSKGRAYMDEKDQQQRTQWIKLVISGLETLKEGLEFANKIISPERKAS